MKKLALAGLVLAGSVAFAPLAFAQEAPAAAVKEAICTHVSVEAITATEDATVSRLERNLNAAEDVLPAVRLEQDRRAAGATAAKAAFDASVAPGSTASLEERNRLKAALDAANKSNEEGNAARAAADQKVADLKAQLAAAQVDQRNAVDLEKRVATFVGTRSFAAVKAELCAPPATTTPNTAPTSTTTTPTTSLTPGSNPGPLYGDTGSFDQVGEVPSAIDTGRA